ncbi:MAG: NADH:flavin oxidoreductase [Henriciella sp.]|nr:NADH:flavin oxidoreductase [Henriciella sp.]
MTSSALSKLFGPCRIAGLDLNNRLVMAPMTRSQSPSGVPDQRVAAYYERRAVGGMGLIITEGTAIDRPRSLDDPNVPHLFGEAALLGWKRVVDAVHTAGAKIAVQLWHVGAFAGRKSAWQSDDESIESPSGLRGPREPCGHAMSEEDIADTIDAYARAAETAVALGFDAVEVHGAHGYLIDQYFWKETNLRADKYGGATVKDRTRFAVEVVNAIRTKIPKTFPFIFRFSQFKQQDYSARLAQTPGELEELLGPLVEAGVDMFHASQRRFWEPEFEGSSLNLAGWTRRVTHAPVITVGSVGLNGDYMGNWQGETSQPSSLDRLLERLEKDEFDLVAIGRAVLNDPYWATKIRHGRTDELSAFDVSALETYY